LSPLPVPDKKEVQEREEEMSALFESKSRGEANLKGKGERKGSRQSEVLSLGPRKKRKRGGEEEAQGGGGKER